MAAGLALVDHVAKAAPVAVSGPSLVGAGLVVWFLHGSIAAVQEALEAAIDWASRMGCELRVVSIGRPDPAVVVLFEVTKRCRLGAVDGEEGRNAV